MTSSIERGTVVANAQVSDLTAFDLKAYLKERQAIVESALDQSINVVYPEKFTRQCAIH